MRRRLSFKFKVALEQVFMKNPQLTTNTVTWILSLFLYDSHIDNSDDCLCCSFSSTLYKILKKKEIWLTQKKNLNDYLESVKKNFFFLIVEVHTVLKGYFIFGSYSFFRNSGNLHLSIVVVVVRRAFFFLKNLILLVVNQLKKVVHFCSAIVLLA